jgi:DNA-binding IclR family transcriptional regulator
MSLQWTFLSNHGKALLCIARDPGARIRDIADTVAITERRAHDIVTDLATAGYVVKTKEGRRNRYTIQTHLPLPEGSGHLTVGGLLAVLAGMDDPR